MATHYSRCYLLRRRAYRETSLLLEMLTEDSKCVHAIYRGARRKRGVDTDLLVSYQMSWRGDHGLVTIRSCEPGSDTSISGTNLYAALYLNELIRGGVHQDQVAPGLFDDYESALARLATDTTNIEPVLRTFEKQLLKTLGYELEFDREGSGQEIIHHDAKYRFVPDKGFVRSVGLNTEDHLGEHLIAISRDEYNDNRVRKTAKLVLSEAIRFHLGRDTIKAQELLQASHIRLSHSLSKESAVE